MTQPTTPAGAGGNMNASRLGPRTASQLSRMQRRAGRVDWIGEAAKRYGRDATVDDIGKLARAFVVDNVDLWAGDRIARNVAEKTARRFVSRLIGRPELAASPEAKPMDIATNAPNWLPPAIVVGSVLWMLRTRIAGLFRVRLSPQTDGQAEPSDGDGMSSWVDRGRLLKEWAESLEDDGEIEAATAIRELVLPAVVRSAMGIGQQGGGDEGE